MGVLSKVGKGLKSAFKKVGKAIKSGLKSVGKFMDKIGIVGQIGLSLLLPGIGGMLASSFQGLVGAMGAYSGVGSTIVKAAGGFLNSVGTVAGNMGKAFSSVTGAIKNVVGETLKFGANKLGLGKVASSLGSTFGSQRLTDLGTSISKGSFDNITSAFGEGFKNITDSFSNVFNPESSIAKNLNIEFDPSNVDATGKPISTASSGVSLEDMSTEIQGIDAGSSLDRMAANYKPPSLLDAKLENTASYGVSLEDMSTEIQGIDAGSSLRNVKVSPTSDFAVKPLDLSSKAAKGSGNWVVDTMKEVQTDLTKKLKEGYQTFKKDPVGTALDFGVEQAKEGIGSGIKSAAVQGTAKVLGVETPDPVFNTYSIAAAAPVDYVEVTPAQQMSQEYFAQNQNLFNTHPYGATSFAVDNNYYQDLNTTMQRMG